MNTRRKNPGGTPLISNDPFAPLRQRFLVRCADQLTELKAIARQGDALATRDALIRIAHSLAGAAGTFGFGEISARASALETLLIDKRDEAAPEAALHALIAEIERTLQ
ncbi:Hpt domain-containing protein [Mesorhizobium sp. M0276]|uniref:Hpt domain-containing protein n=1 Tax=Mesorhizobium sp. M0276 TaxID=2956928 RepID=UPI003336641E